MQVAIVTPILAHYRQQLFRRLDGEGQISFIHYSTTESDVGIRAMDATDVRRFIGVKNVKIGPFLWQKGLLRMAISKRINACIFTGDASYLSTWLAAFVARLTGKRVYFWTIGWHRRERGLRRIIRLFFYRIAHRLMVYSDLGRKYGGEHGYPLERIDVIYNSVSGVSAPKGYVEKNEGKQVAVGAVARVYPSKNLNLLLEAIWQLKERQNLDIKIILGGAGPETAKLRKQAAELGLNCRFLGPIHDPHELADFYKNIMLTVVPSAAGLTTIQSLAHGVPVVTDDDDDTQGPEASAIENWVTGSRVIAGDVEALAGAIAWWLRELAHEPERVVESCHAEVRARWNSDAQAQRVIDSLSR